MRWWTQAFAEQCRAALAELCLLAPWTEQLSASADLGDFAGLDRIPTLRQVVAMATEFPAASAVRPDLAATDDEKPRFETLQEAFAAAARQAATRMATIEDLVRRANGLAQMDYGFLYDTSRRLLAIGYNVGEHRLDASYYDLLASEARFAGFVAIAQGQLPQESWFALGRLLTTTGGEPILLSWSGSMFEYLMPHLVMPTYDNTLLHQTCTAAVASQIEYGKKRGVPWGISECGYNAIDVHHNYQYRAFGVPGLGTETRARRRSGDRPLRLGNGADGVTREELPESHAVGRGRECRKIRLL